MEQVRHLLKQVLADLCAHQRAAGRQDNQVAQQLTQVYNPGVSRQPLGEEPLRLLDHELGVGLQASRLERLAEEPELLRSLRVVHVKDDALAEGGHVELVHLLLAHLQVRAL